MSNSMQHHGNAESAGQAAVIAFLCEPETYGVSEVERVETHGAIVFLAGDRAYKLKRAVKLPYLDFSTLEKRHAIISREFGINSHASPELYLSIQPVTRRENGALALGGPGETVDWVLVMRRFDQTLLLDALARDGRFDRAIAVDLANTVEHFHRHASVVTNSGFARSLRGVADTLEATLCGPGAQSHGLGVCPYIAKLRRELDENFAFLEARQREGFVRRCHGDLHLKNIVLWDGKPTLFDALEFDDRLSTIDVLYDLAFLLMDLWQRGLKLQANIILNHYLEMAAISEVKGLALLPLFLSFRSAIRAMTGIHALAVCAPSDHDRLFREVREYAAFAAAVISPGQPRLVAIGGLSGTGKTTVAREAAPFIGAAPGALHIRTDVERKSMHGVQLTHRLPRATYTPESRDEVYRRVIKKAEVALDSGHSVILDAVFPEAIQRSRLHEVAQRAGAGFLGVWLDAGPDILRERVIAREGDASDADTAVVEYQLRTIEPPADWLRVDASGERGACAAAILRELDSRAFSTDAGLSEDTR
ncbi:AAA family ATPase [Rhodomicrobium udaipurense]|uniref:AAA family ATPase n=2 Tax=Rhodomicrobium udaipurense TaxID=1202716 RepID=A0A8I1KJ34_9HYPH|nr:bifunctional aminoglycoside phosphotransferase/ATP-binding protein [Rhodomicrobium udaipurense]MBJ7543312.1 AAA family ATPase [Rhodomicrobium udaipurense]